VRNHDETVASLKSGWTVPPQVEAKALTRPPTPYKTVGSFRRARDPSASGGGAPAPGEVQD
jgi:hypothetical protein